MRMSGLGLAATPLGCQSVSQGLILTSCPLSPIGEVFRARLRQFPSLVNCCTIDWFNEWPAEALESVATTFLNEIPELEVTPEVVEGLIQVCVFIHQSVAKKCIEYVAELARHNYVTPKSYLELLNIFTILIRQKKQELKTAKNRMESGLDKVGQGGALGAMAGCPPSCSS